MAAWFDFLKAQGYFNPSTNPDPVQVKEGFHVPYWDSLNYLEKLSFQIKESNDSKLAAELIEIIRNVSENPKDNYRTWYVFVKVLLNLPNEEIPGSILEYIPLWLKSRFDTSIVTSELVENLLPKFLTGKASDTPKAEAIVDGLLSVRFDLGIEGEEYRPSSDLYFLKRAMIEGELLIKVAELLTKKPIYALANTLKAILMYSPKGIQEDFIFKRVPYKLTAKTVNEDVVISIDPQREAGTQKLVRIEKYKNYDTNRLGERLYSLILQQTQIEISDDLKKRLSEKLTCDLFSLFPSISIDKIGTEFHDSTLRDVYCLILRDWIDNKSKAVPNDAKEILNDFLTKRDFNIPFFKRIVIYELSVNWSDDYATLFWNLADSMKNGNELLLFNHRFDMEIYHLFKTNAEKFNAGDRVKIESLIEEEYLRARNSKGEEDLNYRKWGYYHALSAIDPFKAKYLTMAKELQITTEFYDRSQGVQISSGWNSPYSVEELLAMKNHDIAEIIAGYNPDYKWSGPSVEGLARELGKAVELNPTKFIDEIEEYQRSYYLYAYFILFGISEAWKKNVDFNWEKVLDFSLNYVSQDSFGTEDLKTRTRGWNPGPDIVTGIIGNLITDGTQSDNRAFDIALIPRAKEILIRTIPRLDLVSDYIDSSMDFPMYSLNSTAGKLLRALLDLSLRKARTSSDKNSKTWDADLKSLFESTQMRGIIDGYVLQGMYYQQFMYLDQEWIVSRIEAYKDLDSTNYEWLAFINGLFFAAAPYNEEIYELLNAHYIMAIESGIDGASSTQGIVHHIAAFYLRGYEDLKPETLTSRFLNLGKPDNVVSFINFVAQQEKYIKELEVSDRKQYVELVLALWKYLLDKYELSTSEKELEIASSLNRFVGFIEELSDSNVDLLSRSAKFAHRSYLNYKIVESLNELKNRGDPHTSALGIGRILDAMRHDHFGTLEQNHLKGIIEFLFTSGHRETAVRLCNKLAVTGFEFQNELFNRYTK